MECALSLCAVFGPQCRTDLSARLPACRQRGRCAGCTSAIYHDRLYRDGARRLGRSGLVVLCPGRTREFFVDVRERTLAWLAEHGILSLAGWCGAEQGANRLYPASSGDPGLSRRAETTLTPACFV